MGSARVPGIACYWCDLSNGSGGHVMATLGRVSESSFRYLRRGGFGFVSPFPSSTCLSQINTHTLCLLLVDLGPQPLLRLE